MARPDFDAWIQPLVDPAGPGVAVAVSHRGELIHAAGYGLANLEWGAAIDTDTVFRIGSITKQFTAAAIVRLAEAGKLEIDDPIERHLPDYPVGSRRITVRHLLNHTSGIPSYTGLPNFASELMRKDLSLAELIAVFKDLPPDFEPGERYRYNNSGYVLLGAIIEAVSGQTYEAHLKSEFFEPLGLTRTSYLHDTPIVPKRASGYVGIRRILNAPPLSMNLPHAAGSLGSTVGDLLTWERALRTGQVVSPAGYQAMTTRGRLNDGSEFAYGFGLGVTNVRDQPTVGHGGGINGFVTALIHWRDDDLTIVALANNTLFPVQKALHGLGRRVLGQADAIRTAIELPQAALEACAGQYLFEVGPPLQMTVKDGGLSAPYPLPGTLYRPFANGRFWMESDPEITITFDQFEGGVPQRLTFDGYGGDPPVFRRSAEPETEA